MNVKPLLLVSFLVAAALAVFAVWAAGQLPPGAELATHWNAAGEVDGTMPALRALLVAPGLLVLVALLFALVPRIEPLQERLDASAPLLRTSWLGLVGMMVFLEFFVAAPVFGLEPKAQLVLVAVGILFLLLGNALPKSRPGFFVGIRTPWTLTNRDNWIATHRLGGKTFMVGGLLMIVAGLFDFSPAARMILTIVALALSALVPVLYSWWYWQRAKAERG